MLLLRWLNEKQRADLIRDEDGEFTVDPGLESALVISLFTDLAAPPELAEPGAMRAGWWADAYQDDRPGSLIWTLRRRTLTDVSLQLLETYAKDATVWLVDDGVAKSITATARRKSRTAALLTLVITPPDGTRFSRTWEVPFGVQ
jgi:phage gp46-like protein